jgi:hypothetical protein
MSTDAPLLNTNANPLVEGQPQWVVDGRTYYLQSVISVATPPASAASLTASPKTMILPEVIATDGSQV